MKYAIVVATIVMSSLFICHTADAAASLSIRPLEYVESFHGGEKKQGHIDVTNPQTTPTAIMVSVQGFRQTDSRGDLSFYPDPQLSAAVLLNEKEATIPANKTLRLFFTLDSSKLPSGDVFGAIFVNTAPSMKAAATASVRLGTLLILQNGTASMHKAALSDLHLPLIATTTSTQGSVAITNIAPSTRANGFFPQLTITEWPFGHTHTVQGPLIYSGITRSIPFLIDTSQIGLVHVTISTMGIRSSRWILALPAPWQWIILAILGIAGVLTEEFIRRRKRA